jgi:1,2-phenylacetyl-CoA epoxidase catalytic subunit
MQRVSAYQPMAESMPQMLREEAFHLATGVVPGGAWSRTRPRRGLGVDGDAAEALNKWLPRGLEMFGHEKAATPT